MVIDEERSDTLADVSADFFFFRFRDIDDITETATESTPIATVMGTLPLPTGDVMHYKYLQPKGRHIFVLDGGDLH
jgi:hypothetical protein